MKLWIAFWANLIMANNSGLAGNAVGLAGFGVVAFICLVLYYFVDRQK
jgi:hypothetical protein